MRKVFSLALGCLLLASACGKMDLAPEAEVTQTDVKLDLPSPPEFKVPPPNPDGTHSVLELRRVGGKHLDKDIKVKGYVIYRYDCVKDIGKKAYEEDPTRCKSKPYLLLGPTPDTPKERTIEVVDVPRPLRKDEIRNMEKEQVRNHPKTPEAEAGDEVIVTGKWATQSPTGFVNTQGLLIYADLDKVGTDEE